MAWAGRLRSAAAWSVGLLGGMAIAFGAGDSRAQPQQADTLVIGMTQYPSTLNPLFDSMLAKSYVLALVRRPFTVFDASWNLVCLLCVELPTLENGGAQRIALDDGKAGIAVTYTIHPEARWADGTPVSTRDVLFTYEVGRRPDAGVSNSELYRRILKVEAHDERRFTFHVDRVTYQYNAITDFAVLPEHLERAAFAEPASYRQRSLYETQPTNAGLYHGPYRVTGVTPGAEIVLERNANWWGKAPAFKRIVVKVIENTAALEANLLSGAIDYVAGELGLSLDQALAFEKRHAQRFDVQFKPGLIYEHIDFNLDNPVLKDRRVRQALILGLDREAISKQLFEGRQPVADGSISPLDRMRATDLARWRYDPKRAAALLDEAGWTLKDRWRQNERGERLRFELMTTAGHRVRELVQQVLQSQWRQLGIDVRIRNEPARTFFGETVSKRQFSAMAMFAWSSAPENVPRTTLHSTQIPSAANNWAGQNYTGFAEPEMDQLLDAIELELDAEKRRPMWRRIEEIYVNELPALPLYFRADPFILPKWLKGVVPTGHQFPTTLWVEDWRVDAAN
jgi:peptide/nickel transport system substrate-binding protein